MDLFLAKRIITIVFCLSLASCADVRSYNFTEAQWQQLSPRQQKLYLQEQAQIDNRFAEVRARARIVKYQEQSNFPYSGSGLTRGYLPSYQPIYFAGGVGRKINSRFTGSNLKVSYQLPHNHYAYHTLSHHRPNHYGYSKYKPPPKLTKRQIARRASILARLHGSGNKL